MDRPFLLLCALLVSGYLPADLKDLPPDFHPDVAPVPVSKDPVTGFLVGGSNSTDLILSLTQLNGRPIADLEADMRAEEQNVTPHRSRTGFLGPDENLLDVLADDNRVVVEQLGLTHQMLAHPLKVMGFVGGPNKQQFTYHGRRFEVSVRSYKGHQFSPFLDKTLTSRDVSVLNLDNGQSIEYSLLVPLMMERYGFYEGKGTRYRVEPLQILAVFDFLTPPPEPPADTSSVWWWTAGLALVCLVLACVWLFRRRS